MPGASHLIDRCNVQRRSATSQGYGAKPAYAAAHLTGEPCRLVEKAQRGFNSITAQWITDTAYKMMFQSEADVLEGDRITNIVLQDGTKLTQNFEVEGGSLQHRGRMSRHRMVRLKKVS